MTFGNTRNTTMIAAAVMAVAVLTSVTSLHATPYENGMIDFSECDPHLHIQDHEGHLECDGVAYPLRVPEPATATLMLLGLGGLLMCRRRAA